MRNSLLIIFLTTISFLNAQDQDYLVEHFSIEEGLYHNYVSKIVSDSLNIKWIATENGINKYDGNKFSVIKPSEKYPELKNENIETLFIDSKNNLWIGTKSGGLSKLDIESNVLSNYNHILDASFTRTLRIREINEDGKGNIWVGTHDNGLYVINDLEQRILKHSNDVRAISIVNDNNGNIWVATNNNINKYNILGELVFTMEFDAIVSEIAFDKLKNRIWVNTITSNDKENLMLYYLNPDLHKIIQVPTNIKSKFATSLFIDEHKKLWIGTWGAGLYKSNDDVTEFTKIKLVDANHKKAFKYDIVIDIHSDVNNVIWISSNYGGMIKLKESKGFHNLNSTLKDSNIKERLDIKSIYSDATGIYIGTLNNGIFFGEDLSQLRSIRGANEGKIHAIHKHKEFIVYGAKNASFFLNKKRKEIKRLNIGRATCFLSESDDILWIGTQEHGLYKFDVSNIKNPKIINHYNLFNKDSKIESDRITSLQYDAAGNMWLGTYNGLHLYDTKSSTFIHHDELLKSYLPSIINTVYVTTQYLWVGTPNGLYKLSYVNNSLKVIDVFTEEDGLKNDFISGIVSDNDNKLWLTTTTNIVCFNQFNNSFINYGKGDGVYTSFFNLRSIHNFNDQILAGGIDNLTYFNASKLKNISNTKELVFTNLKINNKNIQANDTISNNYFLEKDISYTNNLEFSHNEKSFSLGFINNDFEDLATTNYRYKLLGHEENWNYIKNQNEVSFIGLPPGNYELNISSSKDFQNWTVPKILKIKIKYPPLSSPLAYFIYLIIILGVIIIFLRVYFRQKFLRNKLELAELAKEKEHDLNETKLTFFTNISHEFRTPLTLILGPIRELISSKDLKTDTIDKIVIIEKNANRLLNLTNQLLDFRKAEHGLLKLSSSNGNFVRFSNEVFMYFKEQASLKNIKYKYTSNQETIRFPFDRNKMEIVICNLISNAINHTNEGGEIELKLSTDENNCLLHVIDSGIGIEQQELHRIFDRFYQIKNTNTAQVIGSGIGLSFSKKIIELHRGTIEVQSKPQKGTTFIIKLPLSKKDKNSLETNNQIINSDNIDNYEKLTTESISLKSIDNSQKNSILIVDDNNDIRQYLRSLLEDDYTIIEAADGDEGVNLAAEKMPDLVLCDIMMPKKDGLTACKELKSQITTSHIPIIMLTARSANMYEIEGLKIGADDFISKPFDPQIIKARIASALQNRLKLRKHFLNLVRFEPTIKQSELVDAESVFLSKVIKLVEENMLEPTFGIETLMSEFFMSQSTLYRKIKSLTGLSLTVFIRSIRLKKSAEIILIEDIKLSHVAMKVGFNDYKYFRESFVKQFGCLPSEYRDLFNKV